MSFAGFTSGLQQSIARWALQHTRRIYKGRIAFVLLAYRPMVWSLLNMTALTVFLRKRICHAHPVRSETYIRTQMRFLTYWCVPDHTMFLSFSVWTPTWATRRRLTKLYTLTGSHTSISDSALILSFPVQRNQAGIKNISDELDTFERAG